MNIVEVDGLVKVFRDFWHRPKARAVDGASFAIPEGEIFGLLGPNGSGKSTTIKILLGLLHATSGSARILGCSPDDVRIKSVIGYLPEETYLYRYLTARETIDFYGRLFDLDASTRRTRTEQLLDMVGLTHAADRPVGEFSKGMARRVGLAQALINDPKLVILDEPTSGLDPIACRQVKDLLQQLARRGKTILLSSHLLADVEDICARIVILHSGRVRASGQTRTLLEQADRTRLTIPTLPTEQLRTLIEELRKQIGSTPEVDHPSLNLEEFFINVIRQAGLEGTPSGAGSGGSIAPFLIHE